MDPAIIFVFLNPDGLKSGFGAQLHGSNRKTIYLLLKESFMLNLKKYSSTQYIWHLLAHENPNSQKKKCVSSAGQRKDMVLILDGNLEHVAHARRRKGLFGEIYPICGFTRSNQMP